LPELFDFGGGLFLCAANTAEGGRAPWSEFEIDGVFYCMETTR